MQAPAQRFVGHRVATGRGPAPAHRTRPLRRRRHRARGCCTRTSCAARSRTRTSAASTSTRLVAIPASSPCTPAPTSRRSPIRSWASCRCPISTTRCSSRWRPTGCVSSVIRWRSIIAESRYVAEDAGAARRRRLRGARAHRHDRALARSDPSRHLAGARAATCCSATGATTATSTPRSAAPTAWCARPSCSTATPTSRWRRAGAWPRSTPSPARCEYHSATQNSHLMKWSLAALTGRQPVWRVAARDGARSASAWPGCSRRRRRWPRPTRRRRPPSRGRAADHDHDHDHASPRHATTTPRSRSRSARGCRRRPPRASRWCRRSCASRRASCTSRACSSGLLARDPVTLPRVTAQDIGGAFGVKVLPTA